MHTKDSSEGLERGLRADRFLSEKSLRLCCVQSWYTWRVAQGLVVFPCFGEGNCRVVSMESDRQLKACRVHLADGDCGSRQADVMSNVSSSELLLQK